MYNICLDKEPVEYKGYLIRSDYRIGIQITLALEDFELADEDRVLCALELLYGNGIPDDMSLACDGMVWFLSGGRKCSDSESSLSGIEEVDDEVDDFVSTNNKVAYDFEIDSDMIYSALFSQYGVEIDKERIHWFKFLALFKGLKDTEFNDLMYYRTVDISKLPKEQQHDMRVLQNKYSIRKVTAQRRDELIACFGDDWKKHI